MPLQRALVLNAGSSTLKWSVLEVRGGPRPLADGTLEWQGNAPERQAEQVQAVLRDQPAARSAQAVGHRVVHGGPDFRGPVRITPEVRQALGDLVEIDPLHTPAALAGIDTVRAAAPRMPPVAAFDTAFHAALPHAAAC